MADRQATSHEMADRQAKGRGQQPNQRTKAMIVRALNFDQLSLHYLSTGATSYLAGYPTHTKASATNS